MRTILPWVILNLALVGRGYGQCINASFAPAVNFAAGLHPSAVAIGDFNGDGRPDLVAVNLSSDDLTILLGDGRGSFTPVAGTTLGGGSRHLPVAAADFNRDGKSDLAVGNLDSGSVTILLASGAGAFTEPAGSPIGVGSFPGEVAVGEFNGDGKPDLAVANAFSANVTILLGDGSGGFHEAAASPVAVGSVPLSIGVGDFNHDGKHDLAVSQGDFGNVRILLGDGSGGFNLAAGSPVTVGGNPVSVAVSDFNQDGNLDLAVANERSNDVTILLGDGSGGFSQLPGSPFGVGSSPESVSVGDFNGDGNPDLAVANLFSDDLTILLANSSGGFSASSIAMGSRPVAVAVGDFNQDGKPDLAVANQGDNNVSVLLNTCAAWPREPIEELIVLVESAALQRRNKRPLLATLEAARASFERGNTTPGVNQLNAFQNKVRAQLASIDAALAQQLISTAQRIIDALSVR